MKHARKRWLAMVAVCLGMAVPAQSELIVVPDGNPFDAESRYQSYEFSDSAGSARLGGNASGSVRQVQAEVPRPQSFEPVFNGPPPSDGGVGFATMQSPNQLYWRLGRTNIDQYGYNGGYTNFNVFVPLIGTPDDVLTWFNPRINVTDYGMAAANLGGGIRKYNNARDRVYGASFWWDYDDGHSRAFNQVGGSFESIGNYFSLRGNFSIPVGTDENQFNVQNVPGGTSFVGSNISILQSFQREVALQIYDIEAAAPLPLLGRYGFDGGVGAYVLNHDQSGSVTGVSARVQSQISDNFWINGLYTYDKEFDSNFSINFEMTFGHGKAIRYFRRAPAQSYMTQTVQRRYRMAVRQSEGTQTVLATKNGAIINVAFVDPNANIDPSSFDSIFDFDNAGNKSDYQLVYVLRREDDSDVNLNTGVTLLDDQILVGQGMDRSITTDQGPVALPSSSGPAPLLSNSGAANPLDPVITLANNNEVVGFRIDGGNTADAIFGYGIESFNIHDNAITNIINGINITTVTGAGTDSYGSIVNNAIDGNTNSDNDYPSLSGISVLHQGDGTLDLLVMGNVIRGIDEDANQNAVLNDETTAGVDQDFDGIIDADEDLNGNTLRDGIGISIIAENGRINASLPTASGSATGILNNTVLRSANGIEAIVAAAPGQTALFDLTMNGNTVSNLTAPVTDGGTAFRLSADGTNGPSTMNLYSFANNSTSANAGDGLVIDIIGPDGQMNFLGNPTFANNSMTGNAGTGLTFNIVDTEVIIASLSGLTVTGNTGDGVAINVSGVNGHLDVTTPMVGSSFTGNGGNGLVVTATDGGLVDLYFGYQVEGATSGNNFSNNGATVGVPAGNGLVLRATDSGRINTALVGNTFNNNSENGLLLDSQTGGVIDMTGKAFAQLDGSTWVSNGVVGSVAGSLRSQTFNGNGIHGMSILASNGGNINIPFMNGNSFNDNTEAGLFIGSIGGIMTPLASTIVIDSAVDNLFNRTNSGTTGILFNTDNVDVTLTNLLRNQFIGGNANTGYGIGGTVRGGGLELELVTPNAANRNQFAQNTGAHIGLIFEGDSVNSVKINNGTFLNARNDTNVADNFNGDGVALIARDTAVLSGEIRNSRFTGNEGDGVKLVLGGANADPGLTNFAQLNNFIIDSNVIGTTAAGQGNGLNGINIIRDIRGNINNLTISRNSVQGNMGTATSGGAGLAVTSANSDSIDVGFDTFHAWGNVFSDNRNGIELKVMGDADMIANIGFSAGSNPLNPPVSERNFIERNTLNGILAWEQTNSTADSRSISGTWTNNVIRYNADDGIDFRTNAGDPLKGLNQPGGTQGLFIGAGALNSSIYGTTSTTGNIIAYNGRDGIDITGGGLYTIAHNTIVFNGQDTSFNELAMAGINITGALFETGGQPSAGTVTGVTDAWQEVIIYNNAISNNNGDGVQWIAESSFDSRAFTSGVVGPNRWDSRLEMTNNAVNGNVGRGIDLLIRAQLDSDTTDSDNTDPDVSRISGIIGTAPSRNFATGISARGDVLIQNNQVAGNRQEGIYLVASSSGTQSAAQTSSTILDQTGSTSESYFLDISIIENQINGNGNAVTNFPATGLVLRIGTTAGINQYTGSGLEYASGRYSGVVADVSRNTFSGNQGDDFFVHSYTSTVDPATTTGTWSTTEYSITQYTADPLARLDLTFGGNFMDSMTADNYNTTSNVTPDNQVGAFYNNADAFKSRLGTSGAPQPTGPFTSISRRRNATRLRSDWRTDPLDPSTGNLPPYPPANGGAWEYDGMGNSTFRVKYSAPNTIAGSTIINPAALFNLDDPGIITSAGMANGIGFTGTNIFGELPFGWGTF